MKNFFSGVQQSVYRKNEYSVSIETIPIKEKTNYSCENKSHRSTRKTEPRKVPKPKNKDGAEDNLQSCSKSHQISWRRHIAQGPHKR